MDEQLSLLNQNASGYNPFIIRENRTGGLLPNSRWGALTMSLSVPGGMPMPISEMRLFTFWIWFPWPMLKVPPAIAPPCPQNFTIDPGSEVNFISGLNYLDGRDCFAIANVSYQAGITSSQNCKIISLSVVEAQAPSSIIIESKYTPRGTACLRPMAARNRDLGRWNAYTQAQRSWSVLSASQEG